MINPITPKEVLNNKINIIPQKIIDVFNTMIQENLIGNKAILEEDKIVKRIKLKMKTNRFDNFDGNWMGIENIYLQAGWSYVRYDKCYIRPRFIFGILSIN
jgi:hypothetical protein